MFDPAAIFGSRVLKLNDQAVVLAEPLRDQHQNSNMQTLFIAAILVKLSCLCPRTNMHHHDRRNAGILKR
jgi:hypothetical protein